MYFVNMDEWWIREDHSFCELSSTKNSETTVHNTGYYIKLIKGYVEITMPMEKLMKKYVTFQWSEECQKILDVLKENMVIAPILVFPDSKEEFLIHVDASYIALGVRVFHIYHSCNSQT